ncbi:Stress response protein NST1 [Nakaseomyces glabratus]|nr:Salt tolerance down-regulator [Nakaseomyces glabratus]QNG15817.1 uncharacterized protein GWK60_K09625 [Nakaseomyces glabratus]SCV12499.1 Stress response protein NST1 [Nakaseomyces glabratus]SLM10052.1 Stress response protein NST1 [Nakaseomyces glabratus]
MPSGSKSKKKKSKSKGGVKKHAVEKVVPPIEAEIMDERDESDYPTSRVIKRGPNGDVIVESLPDKSTSGKKSKKKGKLSDLEVSESAKQMGITLDSHWESLSPDEKKNILRIEKEEVLEIIRNYQNDHNCSCSVCGRRHMAMNQEMERMYNLLYELEEQRDPDMNPVKFHLGIIKELQISKNKQILDQTEGPNDNTTHEEVVKNFLSSDIADKLKEEVHQFKQKQLSKQECNRPSSLANDNIEEEIPSAQIPQANEEAMTKDIQKTLEQLSVVEPVSKINVIQEDDLGEIKEENKEYLKFTESFISSQPKIAQKFIQKLDENPCMKAITDEVMQNSSYEFLDALKNLWAPNLLKIVESEDDDNLVNLNETLDPIEFTTMLHHGNPLSQQDYYDLQGAISRKVVNAFNFENRKLEHLSPLEVELFGRFMSSDQDNIFHNMLLEAYNERFKEEPFKMMSNIPQIIKAVATLTNLDGRMMDDVDENHFTSEEERYDDDITDYSDSEYEDYDSEYDDIDNGDIISDVDEPFSTLKSDQLRVNYDTNSGNINHSDNYESNSRLREVTDENEENLQYDTPQEKYNYSDHGKDHGTIADEDEDSIDEGYESSIDDMERLEEGRRLIQIAITKLLQGRIMESYHEKEADSNRLKLLKELEEEQMKKKEKEVKKIKKKEKEKEKRRLQQLAKEEEKRKKEEEERSAREEQERREMERREAQRKKVEEAKRKKDEERRRKLEEQRKREEQQEKQRKAKEEQKRKREEEKKKKEELERQLREEELMKKKEEEERLLREKERAEILKKETELAMSMKENHSSQSLSIQTQFFSNPQNSNIGMQNYFNNDLDNTNAGLGNGGPTNLGVRKNSHVLGLTQVYSDKANNSPGKNDDNNEINNEILNIINAATTAKSGSRTSMDMQALLQPPFTDNVNDQIRSSNLINDQASGMNSNGLSTNFHSPYGSNVFSGENQLSNNLQNDILTGLNADTSSTNLASWTSLPALNNLNANQHILSNNQTPLHQQKGTSPISNTMMDTKRDYLGDELSKLTSMLTTNSLNESPAFSSSNLQSSLWNDQNSSGKTPLGSNTTQIPLSQPAFLGTEPPVHRSSIWGDSSASMFNFSQRLSVPTNSNSVSSQTVPNQNIGMGSSFTNPSIWSTGSDFNVPSRDMNSGVAFTNSFPNTSPRNQFALNSGSMLQNQSQRQNIMDNIRLLSNSPQNNGYIPIDLLYQSINKQSTSDFPSFLNNVIDLERSHNYDLVKDQTGVINGVRVGSENRPVSTAFSNFHQNMDPMMKGPEHLSNSIPGTARNFEGNSYLAKEATMNIIPSSSLDR